MKKTYKFASPHLIAFIWTIPIPILMLICGVGIVSSGISFVLITTLLYIYIFMVSGLSLVCHNAYCKYRITEKGIENKNIIIKWENISTYNLVRVRMFKYTGLPGPIDLPPLVCFGDVKTDNFLVLDKKSSVFFALSKTNVKILNKYAQKNKIILDIVSKYYKTTSG